MVLNVTAVNASSSTYVTVWPGGQAKPGVSNLNVGSAAPVANLVVVPVGSGGIIDLSNYSGTVDLLVDLAGYYSPTSPAGYTPVTPCRAFDTRGRAGGCVGASAPVAENWVPAV